MSIRRCVALGAVAALTLLGAVPAHGQPVVPRPVAVIGDFGSGTQDERAVADLVHASGAAAVVTTGDNVYDGNDYARLVGDYYSRWVTGEDLLPATGNHDHEEGIGSFDAYFGYLDGRHVYSAGRGGMRFFVLDSTVALESSDALARQRTWLKRSLASSKARWKIVVLHHPPFSSSNGHGSTPEFQWPFGAWGADLVLSGHDHDYERIVRQGTTYVVNGAGGKDLYPMGDPVAGSVTRFDAEHGALLLTASSTALTGEFRSVSGRVVDRFVLHP